MKSDRASRSSSDRPTTAQPVGQWRLAYLLLLITTIAFGLWLRSRYCPGPQWLTKYGGDALWASMVFFGLGLIWPRTKAMRLATVALCIAWTVEFSQIYHAPWIDRLRDTRPGALILGSIFNPPDLIAYVVGVALAFAVALMIRRGKGF